MQKRTYRAGSEVARRERAALAVHGAGAGLRLLVRGTDWAQVDRGQGADGGGACRCSRGGRADGAGERRGAGRSASDGRAGLEEG